MRLHVRLALPLFAIALGVTAAGVAGVIELVRLSFGYALDQQGRQLAAITEGILRGRSAGLAEQARGLGAPGAAFKARAVAGRPAAHWDLAGSRGADGRFHLAFGPAPHHADLKGLIDVARAAWTVSDSGDSATADDESAPAGPDAPDAGLLLLRAGDRLMIAGLAPGPTPGAFCLVGQRLGSPFARALADLLRADVTIASGGRNVATTLSEAEALGIYHPVDFTLSTCGRAAVTFTFHVPAADAAKARTRALAATLAGGGLLFALALLFYGWTVFRITRPIRDLSIAVERISAGHLEERLPTNAPAELGVLVRQFNVMSAALRQAQERLVHSAKLSSVGQMVAGISHELNNPLWGLIGHAEFLTSLIGPGQPGRQELDIILGEANRMKRALADLRGFVKPGGGERIRLDLNAVAGEVLTLVRHDAEKAGVEIRRELAAEPVLVRADPDAVRQILLNFTLNALQAMRTGGTLTVRTGRDGPSARLTVEDSGHGLDPEAAQRLAEPFFTTKPGHLGLGLAISTDVARSHGGRVELANRPGGGGARAVLELPLAGA